MAWVVGCDLNVTPHDDGSANLTVTRRMADGRTEQLTLQLTAAHVCELGRMLIGHATAHAG